MNAHDFYSKFMDEVKETRTITKEMLPRFPETWGNNDFLSIYKNNEPAYTELINKYIIRKIITDAGMEAQHEYFRIDTVG